MNEVKVALALVPMKKRQGDMAQIDIRRIDLSLLLTFASLMKTRRTTATAGELSVTQSAVSHSLARLRDIFGDELFLRRPHGLEPTRRALELEPVVGEILELARSALWSGPFDPARATSILRIGALDYHCALLAEPFLKLVEENAPGVKVSFRPIGQGGAVDAVLAGELDFALGLFRNVPEQIELRRLWTETFVVAVAAEHAPEGEQMKLADYLKARHIVISNDGELSGAVDRTLTSRRLTRNVVAAAPYCLSALATVSKMKAMTTLPERLARAYAPIFGLKLLRPPVPVRRFNVNAIRARRTARDGLINWSLDRLAEIAALPS
jgi:DNA-binding transcriptional LysR family regulator